MNSNTIKVDIPVSDRERIIKLYQHYDKNNAKFNLPTEVSNISEQAILIPLNNTQNDRYKKSKKRCAIVFNEKQINEIIDLNRESIGNGFFGDVGNAIWSSIKEHGPAIAKNIAKKGVNFLGTKANEYMDKLNEKSRKRKLETRGGCIKYSLPISDKQMEKIKNIKPNQKTIRIYIDPSSKSNYELSLTPKQYDKVNEYLNKKENFYINELIPENKESLEEIKGGFLASLIPLAVQGVSAAVRGISSAIQNRNARRNFTGTTTSRLSGTRGN